jgi:acetoacetyl-CoA synthetase
MDAVLWRPPADVFTSAEMGRFAARNGFDDYASPQRWSVTDLEGFWQAVWDFYELHAHTPAERVLGARGMPGAEWFEGATLDYAEHMLPNLPEVQDSLIVHLEDDQGGTGELVLFVVAELDDTLRVASRGALVDPGAIDAFVEFSEGRGR